MDRLGRGQAPRVPEVRGASSRPRDRRVEAEGRKLEVDGREARPDLRGAEERRGARNGNPWAEVRQPDQPFLNMPIPAAFSLFSSFLC